ncbi:MAG: restriction endonuclease [Candidatus Nitrosotenuis sp.]
MNYSIIKIKNYIKQLNEDDFRTVLKSFLEMKCGYAELWHSSAEHGVDIVALYKKEFDFVKRDITILVQVKKGRIGLKELRTNIFGQMSEMFVRQITTQPFHPFNPRRLLLIISGELSLESRNLIKSWNEKMPLPIELIEIDEISEFLYETFGDLQPITQLIKKKAKPTKKRAAQIPVQNLELSVQGKEDVVGFVSGFSN